MPASPQKVCARTRSAIAGSAGTASTVATATAPPADRGLGEHLRDGAVEPQILGQHQPAVTAHPPTVAERAMIDRLAHRRAAEHHRLGHQQRSAGRKLDLDAAVKPRPVEQDRLLRQPRQAGVPPDRELDRDLGWRPERAIDFLRRSRGDGQRCAILHRDVEVMAVAAGNAAGGVDDHRFERPRAGVRKPHAQRTVLIDLPAPRHGPRCRNRKRDPPRRAVGRKHAIERRRLLHAARPQSAIAFLSAASSTASFHAL